MTTPLYRDMTLADADAVISLNEAVKAVTSPMDVSDFTKLFELSTLRLMVDVDDDAVGFVFAMTQGRPYENVNYRWFAERYSSLLYIDRVVVSATCRGMGIGSGLYSRILETAETLHVKNVCAEMDLDPPNLQSLAFHANFGFEQIGTTIHRTGKQLSMQSRSV